MKVLGSNSHTLLVHIVAGVRRLQRPSLHLGLILAAVVPVFSGAAESQKAGGKPAAKVSYYREVRPILQANCQGCHQPAKSKGGYVMTEFKRLLGGGDTEGP